MLTKTLRWQVHSVRNGQILSGLPKLSKKELTWSIILEKGPLTLGIVVRTLLDVVTEGEARGRLGD